MDKKILGDILEQHLFVSDEWGGSKLANWQWGNNVVVDGIDDTVEAIMEYASQQADASDAHDKCPKCAGEMVEQLYGRCPKCGYSERR